MQHYYAIKTFRFFKILIAAIILLAADSSGVMASNTVALSMDTVTIPIGQQVVVNVKAWDFIMMLAAQGTIGFDTSELSFVDVEQFGTASLITSNFGTSHAASGYITFSWTDQTLLGTTIANDTEFFAIRFLVKNTACQNTAVSFLNSPTPQQYVDTSFNQIPDTLFPGLVIPTGLSIAASVSPLNPSICSGQNVTLTASGASNFLWSTGSITDTIHVSPGATAVYTVTATNSNGCSAQASDTVVVSTSVAPTVNVNASQTTICSGTNVIFTATPTNGGNTPAYQWKKNGINVGTNSAGYSNNALNNNDSVWVVLTSSSTCASPDSAKSNVTHIAVSSGVVPAVSVHASQTSICGSASVTFTATPTNGGPTPNYQWKKNGNNVGTNSAVYIDNGLNNNDSVWVVLTSSLICASPITATSLKTKMTVNPIPTAPVAGSNSPVTSGGTINLTAGNISNATYIWSGPNGYSSTQQNPAITGATTSNTGTYQVIATVNGCNSLASSVTVTVNNPVTGFVLFMDTVTGAAGQQVVVHVRPEGFVMMLSAQGAVGFDTSELHFVDVEQFGIGSLTSSNFGTGSAANGNISFSWTDPTLSGTTIANDSEFFAIRFAVQAGACRNTAVSFLNSPTTLEFVDTSFNTIAFMVYNGMVKPTGAGIIATISPVNPSTCSGQNVVLTASGGTGFTWSDSSLTDTVHVGPASTTIYTVTVTNNNGCSAQASDTVIVGTNVVPTVSVNASQTTICTGTNVIFTATPANGGGAPTYQWEKNGVNVGTNNAGYSDNSLNNNDSVWVVLTSSSTCASPDTAKSNVTHITINTGVVPSVSINASQTILCANTNVTFTATPTNGGLTPTYQWKKNGSNVGTSSATYSDNGLNNNDSVWVVLTSGLSCASPATATSNKEKMTVNPIPSAPGAGSNSPVTTGGTINLTAGNINNATYQWSGPNGYTSTQQNPGINGATLSNSGTYQVIATVNGCNSLASSVTVTVNNPVGSFVLFMDTVTAVAGQQAVVHVRTRDFTMMLSAQGTIGFDTSELQFTDVEQFGTASLISSNFGTGGAANGYITFSWTDQTLSGTTIATDSEFFAMRFTIAAGACNKTPVSFLNTPTSLEFVDTSFSPISYALYPGMVVPTGGSTVATVSPVGPVVCSTQSTTLTAGSGASYNWSTGATTNSITVNPANTTVYKVTVTNANGCSALASDTVHVAGTVVPSIVVNASQTTVCPGTTVVFTATPTNGGAAPGYQWKRNGGNAGTDSVVFSSNSLNNNDSVWVVLTSSSSCASPVMAKSNVEHITISPIVAPSVIVSASQTTVCAGSTVVFTATPTNGGVAPAYQWKKNGNSVGTDSSVYSDNSLSNNDSVWVVLTSSSGCASPASAVSNVTYVTVNTNVVPLVTVVASQTTICTGTGVTFTATPANGGTAPVYQWKKNGNNTGTNNAVYTDNSLSNNDSVWVVLTSNATCASPATAVSNVTHITVSTSVVPSVSISASQTTICTGSNVLFTAIPSNGGLTPAYQWQKNGNNVGTNSATYSDNGLNNNDSVWVTMVSSVGCASPASAASNKVLITVSTTVLPVVTVSASPATICAGATVTFTATPVNGGITPVYQWVKNGTNVSSNSVAYGDNTLNPGDSVWVVLTSSAGCANPTSVTSNKTGVTVNPVPVLPVAGSNSPVTVGGTISLTASSTNGARYQWSGPAGYGSALQNPSIFNATLAMTGTYQVIATLNGCHSLAATVAVTVNAAAANVVLYMDTVSGNDGQQVVVDMRAINFAMMVSAQGTIGFDTSKLQFVDVEDFGLSGLNGTDFGTSNALSGYIAFAWNDPTLTGNSISNDSEFFAIRFKVASGICTGTTVTFLNGPTASEFVDTSFNSLNSTLLPGKVNAIFVASDSTISANGPTVFCEGDSVILNAVAGDTYAWSNQSTAQSIIVHASGNYLVTITNSNNCSAVSSATTVTVNTNPTATVTPGTAAFCAGDSVRLSAAGGSTYLWSNSSTSQNIVVSTSANYKVTVTNSNNCSAVSAPVTVTVNPLPSVSFTLPADTICLHASPLTITGGSPTGGAYSGTAVSGGIFNPSTAGQGNFNITYAYTDGNNCSASATASIKVEICEGVDIITPFNWSIYPNPANSNLTISMEAESVPAAFVVYDVLGNKITDGEITTGKYLLDVNKYATGLYYLKVYRGQEMDVKSFVVVK